MDLVRIFDTTLRDGEQSPGFSMNGICRTSRCSQFLSGTFSRAKCVPTSKYCPREIPPPAGESAGVRDDAIVLVTRSSGLTGGTFLCYSGAGLVLIDS